MGAFEERELEILREAVDKIKMEQGALQTNLPEVKEIIGVVEDFIRGGDYICYGGTAINNILPYDDQFYDRSVELPDYDFFSTNAMEDSKLLADLYYKKGYREVEAKAGIHYGTYKVFVNFIPVADITQLSSVLFKNLKEESMKIDGIMYASPLYLRMSMYLELSRPKGDVSRWEKVLNRLILLNKHYPLKTLACYNKKIRRAFEKKPKWASEKMIYNVVKDSLIREGVVFFGAYAMSLYSKYLKRYFKNITHNNVDFDVLSQTPEKTAKYIEKELEIHGVRGIKIKRHSAIDELVPEHYELLIGKETILFIYGTNSCSSYNEIVVENKKIKVASIETILYLYLIFIFTDKPYHDKERLLCLGQFLFVLQEKNRLKQVGLLKRFSTSCYGEQETLETIRNKKTRKFKELSKKGVKKKEYDRWFLKYVPKTKKKVKIMV